MPIKIPAFALFQGSTFPLRGLWNHRPKVGDKFVNAEIDWGTYPPGQGAQFQLSGNSPVALEQIVALSVDNSRCGSDVQFIFPDSGFVLLIPAGNQGVYPVFTNALQFYCIALSASPTDVTAFNAHNSMPPPIQIQASNQQQTAAVQGIGLGNAAPASVQIVPASVNGRLRALTVTAEVASGTARLSLQDGTGKTLWTGNFTAPGGTVNVTGLNLAFQQGILTLLGTTSAPAGSEAEVSAYYTVP